MSRSSRQASPGDAVPSPAASDTDMTFEKAIAELERIVAQMEEGELSLERSLGAHKRGLELARYCQQRLDAARAQVKVLEGDVLRNLSSLQAGDGGEGA
ncbi:MAG: exodeoxyribonuclease VII small subunit [Betaproteobacteria bacterium]|nr:exodeoxyribonuclease VII small subunit [Betaproteobacteria bacterium]